MDLPLILDAAILIILLIFLIRGFQRGFIRAFCSFLAVFVALFGALVISKHFTPMATEMLAPKILPSIIKQLEKDSTPESTQNLSPQDTAILLKKIGLPQTWNRMIEQSVSNGAQEKTETFSPSQLLAQHILTIIISASIFIISFLLLLLFWLILSRSLDLLAKLPVLNFFNRLLGALFGLCKGLIFLLLLRWLLCDLLGQIPTSLLQRTWSYQILASLLSQIPLPNLIQGSLIFLH